MPILLTAHKISKSFGGKSLFRELDLVVESGERIGLIGPNGTGKSTLLRMLAAQETTDEGKIAFAQSLRTAFVEQSPQLDDHATIEEAVMGATGKDDAHSSMARQAMAHLSLNGVGVPSDTIIGHLSGGWKKRVALAQALAKDPDLLLLDEPTNHLDVESILWLEALLARSRFATVTITHDRLFLQRVANRIVELNRRHANGLLNVRGDYAEYLQRNEEILAIQEREQTTLSNKLRRETEWLRRGPKARTTKQQARIQRAGDLKEEVADLNSRNQTKMADLEFQSSGRAPQKLIEATLISKKFSTKPVFRDLSLLITPKSRLGLLGPNGCGKSTLLKVLLKSEAPDSGVVFHSNQLKVAYFEQNRETLDPELTVLKTVCPSGDSVIFGGRAVHIRGYLDRFLFRTEQADIKVGKLSGGEQSRLLIARLMLQPANVLVLDEPTNDLDMATLDVLMDTLTEFAGAVLLVTHDRYFLDQVASQIVAFDPRPDHPGELHFFAGLSQWENWHEDLEWASSRRGGDARAAGGNEKKRRMSYKEVRELETMEAKIQETEEKLAELTTLSTSAEHASNAKKLTEVYEQLAEVQTQLDNLYERWAELEKLKNSL